MNFNGPVTREDLKPYLNNSLLSRFAEVLHRYIFQPIENTWDRMAAYFTRRMVEKELNDR